MSKRNISLFQNGMISMALFIVATLVGWQFKELGFTEPNIVVVYLLIVLLTARFTEGYVYGIMTALMSVLGFNYFFTAPYHTFNVYDPSYFITFAIMTMTSVITSMLTSKEKLYTKKAEEKERESRALYTLTNQLSDAESCEKIIEVTLKNVYELLQVDIGFVYFENKHHQIFIEQKGLRQVHRTSDETKNLWEMMQNLRTEYLEENEYIDFPINGSERLLGVLRIHKNEGLLVAHQRSRLLHSMLENTGMALDRKVTIKERMADHEAAIRERYRANLLRAISHDLRTPLAGIMGTAEMLMDMTQKEDHRYELMWDVYQDADWLHSLVENILSLTRLQDGKMIVKKEPEALEEVIEGAVSHIEKIYKDREIEVNLPDTFKLVPMDAKLIQQVITNLLDNAVKHTLPKERISVQVIYEAHAVAVYIRDEGTGIRQEDLHNIFQMFYTTGTQIIDGKKGIGLGLAICETVIKAHEGSITGGNRKDKKGAEFMFKLPLEEGEQYV